MRLEFFEMLQRKDLIALNFQYDNLVMEEAAQIMEIETFIPMVLQARRHAHRPLLPSRGDVAGARRLYA